MAVTISEFERSWTDCFIYSYRGHKIVKHDGLNYGFGLTHFFLPDQHFGGVIVGNSGDANDVAAVVYRELIDALLNVPRHERPDWNKQCHDDVEHYAEEGKNKMKELKEEMLSAGKGDTEQKIALSAYTGQYWNPGYKGMEVEIKDGQLYIDASDRSMGFFVTFEHICDSTKYVIHLSDFVEGGDIQFAAEFVFEEEKVVKMGLGIEEDLDGLIWFDKVR